MEIIGQAQTFMQSLGIDQWNNGYPNAAIFEQDIARESCHLFFLMPNPVGLAASSPSNLTESLPMKESRASG